MVGVAGSSSSARQLTALGTAHFQLIDGFQCAREPGHREQSGNGLYCVECE